MTRKSSDNNVVSMDTMKQKLRQDSTSGEPDLVMQIIEFCIRNNISYDERQKMMTVLAEGKAETLSQALSLVRG